MPTAVAPYEPSAAELNLTNSLNSKRVLKSKLCRGLVKLKRALVATQVIYRGNYSIERLLALEEYTRTTSFLRVLLVCAGTPLPIMVIVFSQEALPLTDPEDGWRANWGFWIRAAILSGTASQAVVIQFKYLVQDIDVSLLQLGLLFPCMAIGYTAASIRVASLTVFPIPYMIIVMTPVFLLLLVGTMRILLGASTVRKILDNRYQLVRYTTAFNTQALMAVCCPAYQALFKSVAVSAYELPVFLMLPLIKIVLKNLVSLSLAELADMIPEKVIFTVHFFNAIYLATCMQSSVSAVTVVGIMVVDCIELVIALISILRKTLAMMFTIECIVLGGYVKYIIPYLYGSYVLMMMRLPSAKYHTGLAGVTEENVGSTVKTVFVYGSLELVSFLLRIAIMKRGCWIQALYHLAFVLETQALSIRVKSSAGC